jgi:hypothetical protein
MQGLSSFDSTSQRIRLVSERGVGDGTSGFGVLVGSGVGEYCCTIIVARYGTRTVEALSSALPAIDPAFPAAGAVLCPVE